MLKKIVLWLIVFAISCQLFINAAENEDVDIISWKQEFGTNLLFGISDKSDLILHKDGFSIGYSYKYRQAIWVAYVLFADNLSASQVQRSNKFKADKAVKNPVQPQDYNKTGYDRGHLAPAADMTYSDITMQNSFLMTNISPQIPGCNRGIWKRVENQIRSWAFQEKILYVITGPIFAEDDVKKLGITNIPIPVAFYKIVFDMTPPCKMIGFIVPNQTTKRRVPSFAVSVDEIEKLTDIDFFSQLPEQHEKILEAQKDFYLWSKAAKTQ